MTRERFVRLVKQALDGIPERFRQRIQNVAILVEDLPASHQRSRARRPRKPPRPGSPRPPLLMGLFVGTPATQKSVFAQTAGPDHVILYQKNIEAVCRTDDEIREEIRLTLLHELGHYFGLSEDELRHL